MTPDVNYTICRVRGLLRSSKFPSEPSRIARIVEASPDVVGAALADLIARGVAEEVAGRSGSRYMLADRDPEPAQARHAPENRRDLTDGERIAAGLGTTWAPLPMLPGLSPLRADA